MNTSFFRLDASSDLPPVSRKGLKMGTSRRPDGRTLSVDSRSLLLDEKPWLPISGELHFSRIPQEEWRAELLKTMAGGIDLLATYVFWIHHEESESQWNWAGQRDLRRFVELCGKLNLPLVVRCGPWCHGEVRNGGFPDWVIERKGMKVRSDDSQYLELARRLYVQIAGQLEGLLWKDGGPVVGIQVENEYRGPAEHLLTLKKLAQEVGLDVPLYTRTGWPKLSTPMPEGELLPLFGAYAEGFWDRELTPMPGTYGANYLFRLSRSDAAVGTDFLGQGAAQDAPDIAAYPYFCCEIGGGMPSSYHRRIALKAQDIESTALVKLGSGNNLQGYYMVHGGTNPPDSLVPLQEAQNTAITNWNDLPVKSYDFGAPLGEFGQVNPHYHSLRRMHLFTRDFGGDLATYPACLPEKLPLSEKDTQTLRWAARSDGERGFVFVNNYHRLQTMPAQNGLQFDIKLRNAALRMPSQPVEVPSDSLFFWPFNLELGGAQLIHATAQPLCKLEDEQTTYAVFAQTPGVSSEFVFEADGAVLQSSTGQAQTAGRRLTVRDVRSGTGVALHLQLDNGRELVVILLDEVQSLTCYKGRLAGRERLVLTRASVQFEADSLQLQAENAADLSLSIFPALTSIALGETRAQASEDGLFAHFAAPESKPSAASVQLELVREAGPTREIHLGSKGVAQAPDAADFANAAVWRVRLPEGANLTSDALLRVSYRGDVARFYLGDTLLTDNFYNGRPFDLGLQRFAPEIFEGELLLQILPLRKDAPLYLPEEAKPDFGSNDSLLELLGVEFIERPSVRLTVWNQWT